LMRSNIACFSARVRWTPPEGKGKRPVSEELSDEHLPSP